MIGQKRMRGPISFIASLCALLLVLLPGAAAAQAWTHFQLGDPATPTPGAVSGGLLLLGGGDRDPDTMRWFFAKAGHGHIVVLRASQGGEIGEEFFNDLGGIASVETFVFAGREAATDPAVLAALAHADGIFIAGGDQSRYVRYWRGTPIAAALDAHVAAGKPLAGTSAGLAMLGERLYGAMDGGSIVSRDALADPFGPANTIEGDFLHLALLKGVVTDTHFKQRDRLGRLLAFLARAQAGRRGKRKPMLGLGVDEAAALAVEPDGSARVYANTPGRGAWLVDGATLRRVAARGPLNVAHVRVTGIGADSVLHLPGGKVDRPTFVRDYRVKDGVLGPFRTLPKR